MDFSLLELKNYSRNSNTYHPNIRLIPTTFSFSLNLMMMQNHLQLNCKCFLKNSSSCELKHTETSRPGLSIISNIEGAVRESYKIVIILSKGFKRSSWCEYESHLTVAHNNDLRNSNVIIPIKIDQCETPTHLKAFEVVQFSKKSDDWLRDFLSFYAKPIKQSERLKDPYDLSNVSEKYHFVYLCEKATKTVTDTMAECKHFKILNLIKNDVVFTDALHVSPTVVSIINGLNLSKKIVLFLGNDAKTYTDIVRTVMMYVEDLSSRYKGTKEEHTKRKHLIPVILHDEALRIYEKIMLDTVTYLDFRKADTPDEMHEVFVLGSRFGSRYYQNNALYKIHF